MALKLKIDKLVEKLGAGKDYYCFEVPQEYHVWTLKNQWKSFKKEYDVALMGLKVRASEPSGTITNVKHPRKNPRSMDCGVEVVGIEKVSGRRIYIWEFRVDGTGEANQVLAELCEKDDIDSFDIKELEVYNAKSGTILHCERHNPDSNMESLYIVGFSFENQQKLYPEVLMTTQEVYVGTFQDNRAHCCQTPGMVKACALKNKLKKAQIIRRPKAQP